MSIPSRVRVVVFLALASLATAACGGSSSDPVPDSEDSDVTKSANPLTDAELASALAKVPAKLTDKQAKQLIDATVNPVATTARLKMLNDFVAARGASIEDSLLPTAMEGIFWGTPRDLASAPKGFGGQSFHTTVAVDAGIAAPTRVTVLGVATTAYTLDFMISGFHVKGAHVPAGATAADTAKLIAKALDASNEKIMSTITDSASFALIGGDHAEAQSGVDDLEISVSGATVELLVAQNGG